MGETMWKVLLISYLFSCVTVNADKELLGDEISSDILQEIQKRLDIPPKCHSTRHSSTIIRTNESLSAGADFLTSRNVGSERSCQKLCCQYTDCNVAIFEGDDEEGDGLDGGRQCYLFNCGSPNKCTFTHHRHYVSMSVKKLVNQHVTELKDLSKSVPDTEPGRDSEEIGEFPGDNEVEEEEAPPITTERTVMPSTTTTTVSTTMTTSLPATTPASTTVEPRVVAMLHHCRPQDKCDGEKTECIDGFCRCKTGYHPKNGVCRMNCNPHLEFECTNGDAKINGPDCIAVYDACDGIAQCADGSDEQFCDKSEGELATVDKSEEEHSQLNSARTGSGVGANEETQTVFRWEDRPGDGPSDSVKAGESLDGKGKTSSHSLYSGGEDGYRDEVEGGVGLPQLRGDEPHSVRVLGNLRKMEPHYRAWNKEGNVDDKELESESSEVKLGSPEVRAGSSKVKSRVGLSDRRGHHIARVDDVAGRDPATVVKHPTRTRPRTTSTTAASVEAHEWSGSVESDLAHHPLDSDIFKDVEAGSKLKSHQIVKEQPKKHHQYVEPPAIHVHKTPHWLVDQSQYEKEPQLLPKWPKMKPDHRKTYNTANDWFKNSDSGPVAPRPKMGQQHSSQSTYKVRQPSRSRVDDSWLTLDKSPLPSRHENRWKNYDYFDSGPDYPAKVHTYGRDRGNKHFPSFDYRPSYGTKHRYHSNFDRLDSNQRGHYPQYDRYDYNYDYDNDGERDRIHVYPSVPASGTKSKVPPVKMPDKGQPQSNPTSEDGQEVNRPNLDHLEHKESTKSNIEVNPSKGSEENQVLTEVTSAGEPQPYSTIPAPTTSSEPFNTGNKDVDMTTAGITDVIMPSERSKLQPGKKATPSPNRPSVSSINNIGKEAKSSSTSVSKSEAQGAVIALSLGLSVTALLLLFVGCRYRNMKRKIRRGRPLNSNEADYLINGMYL